MLKKFTFESYSYESEIFNFIYFNVIGFIDGSIKMMGKEVISTS